MGTRSVTRGGLGAHLTLPGDTDPRTLATAREPADVTGVTTFSWAGFRLPAPLRPVSRPAVPEVRSQPVADGDLLSSLGFEPGEAPDEPRIRWARPAAWPSGHPRRA